MIHYVKTPLDDKTIRNLRAGDIVRISGTIYNARDAAHAKMVDMIAKGMKLPFNLHGQIIYYMGPCKSRPGRIIGAAGPTTSGRMDIYTPLLIELGLKGMIGKGSRDNRVINSIIKHNAVYFGAVGGAGALLSTTIKSQKIIAFEELGTEAVRELEIEDFPAIVVIDCKGNNLYAFNS